MKESNALTNLIIVLGSSTGLMYLVGYFYTTAYYSILGVPLSWVDFSYNEYLSLGFLNSFGTLIIFAVFFYLIVGHWFIYVNHRDQLRKQIRFLTESLRELNEIQKNEEHPTQHEVKAKELENVIFDTIEEYKKSLKYSESRERKHLETIGGKRKYFHASIYISFGFAIIFFLTEYLRLFDFFFSFGLIFLIVNILMKAYMEIAGNLKSKSLIFIVGYPTIIVTMVLMVGLFPILDGIVSAKVKLHTGAFTKVEIYEDSNEAYEAQYILHANGNHVISKDGNILLLPSEKVSKINITENSNATPKNYIGKIFDFYR